MRAAAAAGTRPTMIITFAAEHRERLAGGESIDDAADELGAELRKVSDINGSDGLCALREGRPDHVFVVGWPQLMHDTALACARLGTYGMHPTLLPRHRGRAAIPWTILNDLAVTGVSLFQIDSARADAGPLVGQQVVEVDPQDDAGTLFHKIDRTHGELVARHIDTILSGRPSLEQQDETFATYWPKRTPRDGMLDWNMTSTAVERWVRAHTRPYPGARTTCGGAELAIWRAIRVDDDKHPPHNAAPGTIMDQSTAGPVVQCGSGAVILTEIQLLGSPDEAVTPTCLTRTGTLLR